MQVGVFDGSAIPPVSAADKLLSNISQLIKEARKEAIPIIFVQHNGENGHPLERKTIGWDFHPKLDVTDKDLIVQKSTPDSFYDTDLQDILRSNKIRKVVIAGIQTEFCIDTTCRRAFSMGYEITLVKDAHSTWGSYSGYNQSPDAFPFWIFLTYHLIPPAIWLFVMCSYSGYTMMGVRNHVSGR